MKTLLLILLSFLGHSILAQSISPTSAPLPDKFDDLEALVEMTHFPSPVMASTDCDEPGTYFWKHTSTVFSPNENLTVLEGGAYIYYNDQWNLRVAMPAKEFSKHFNIPKGEMKAGQPYTFVDNWRRDASLRGGWAMWYIIAETASGEKVYGVGKLDTVGSLYKKSK